MINGASEFLADVFGEAGRHARSAVGVAELPLGVPVEVEAIFEVRLSRAPVRPTNGTADRLSRAVPSLTWWGTSRRRPRSRSNSLPAWVTLVRAPNPGPMTLDGTNTWMLRAPGRPGAHGVDPGPLDEEHLAAIAEQAAVGVILSPRTGTPTTSRAWPGCGSWTDVDAAPRPGTRR